MDHLVDFLQVITNKTFTFTEESWPLCSSPKSKVTIWFHSSISFYALIINTYTCNFSLIESFWDCSRRKKERKLYSKPNSMLLSMNSIHKGSVAITVNIKSNGHPSQEPRAAAFNQVTNSNTLTLFLTFQCRLWFSTY